MSTIILISPPEQHLLVEAGDRPAMGLLYLIAALNQKGHIAIMSDLNHDSYYILNEKIKRWEPQYIGITIATPYLDWAINFAKHLRHNYPAIKLIAGGPHASALPESLQIFDHIIVGEGERAIVDIIEDKIKNHIIAYPPEQNIDKLPIPAWNAINYREYGIMQEGERTAVILSSRSCPASCFFCAKKVMGVKWRAHSVNRIIKEIQILKGYGFNSFYFIDDCFTVDKQRVLEFCKIIQENKYGSFRITSRTDMIDEERMSALKDAGLRSISFGLEHMDQLVLDIIQKGNTIENNIKAVRLAKQYNIKVRGSFIINLPGATQQSVNACLDFAMQENLDFADFYLLIAYPGTPMWEHPEKFGIIIDKNVNVYQTSGKTNVATQNMTIESAEKLSQEINAKWRKFKGSETPWELK